MAVYRRNDTLALVRWPCYIWNDCNNLLIISPSYPRQNKMPNYYRSVPFVVITIRAIPDSWLMVIIEYAISVTRQLWLMKLLTRPEHLSSFPVCSGVRAAQVLLFGVVFCASLFGHCFVCHSSIYRLWVPLWYLRIFMPTVSIIIFCIS